MSVTLSKRSKFIVGLARNANLIGDFGLISALCQCLPEKESCRLLRRCIAQASSLRDKLLRKVCEDIDRFFLPVHDHLVLELIDLLESSGARTRQSAGYCLSFILPHLPQKKQSAIISAFLQSRYIGIRRRAYKWLSKMDQIFSREVVDAWNHNKDPESAWVIVKCFPINFVIENRINLLHSLTEGWQISRLYLRIGEKRPDLLVELRSLDPISYCYVLAKLGIRLSLQQAKSYIDTCASDERFGLLVWSLGRLRHWSALQYLYANLSAIQEKKLALHRAKHAKLLRDRVDLQREIT